MAQERVPLPPMHFDQVRIVMPSDLSSILEMDSHNPESVNHQGTVLESASVASRPRGTVWKHVKLGIVVAAFCICNFLSSVDGTIISTATPTLSDHFNTLQDIGWYISSYLLTNGTFQVLYAKLYAAFKAKFVFLLAMILFEAGSLVSALAMSSALLTFGRALTGAGASGILSGALVIIQRIVPQHWKISYCSVVIAVYNASALAAPLIGGAFTSHVSWRWCFYLNIPVGAATMMCLLFFLDEPGDLLKHRRDPRVPLWRSIASFDPIGTLMLLGSMTSLLLALNMGGTTHGWSDPRMIALLSVFGVLFVAFIVLQLFLGENATAPLRILTQRSIYYGCLYMFCVGAHFFIVLYFLPVWFQTVHGESAVQSGVHTVPVLLAGLVSVVLGGILVTFTGCYVPLVWASVILTPIGAGLLTTLNLTSSRARWIGFQVLYGLGGSLGCQQAISTANTVLEPADAAMGTALMLLSQNIGGTVFASAACNLFDTRLLQNLAIHVPELEAKDVLAGGITGIRHLVKAELYEKVAMSFNESIMETFRMGLVVSCLCLVGAAGMEILRAITDGEDVEAYLRERAKGDWVTGNQRPTRAY